MSPSIGPNTPIMGNEMADVAHTQKIVRTCGWDAPWPRRGYAATCKKKLAQEMTSILVLQVRKKHGTHRATEPKGQERWSRLIRRGKRKQTCSLREACIQWYAHWCWRVHTQKRETPEFPRHTCSILHRLCFFEDRLGMKQRKCWNLADNSSLVLSHVSMLAACRREEL